MAYENFYNVVESDFLGDFTDLVRNMSFDWEGVPSSLVEATKTSDYIVINPAKEIKKYYYKLNITSGADLTKGGVLVFKNRKYLRGNAGVERIGDEGTNEIVKIKKPISIDGTKTEPCSTRFVLKGWLSSYYKSTWYYYPIYEEVSQKTVVEMFWVVVTGLSKTSFEPYEPITKEKLGNLDVTAQPRETIFDSSSIGRCTFGTLKRFGIDDLKREHVTITYPFTFKFPNSEIELYLRYNYNNENYDYRMTLSITDWVNKVYQIVEGERDYKVYAGKEIGSSFLNHFSLIYITSNEYKIEQSIVQSSLEKGNLSKTIFSHEDNYVCFTYNYLGHEVEFTSEKEIIQLAEDESTRFSLITKKTEYKIGETLSLSDIDIKNSGKLTYSDGTTISISDVHFDSDPIATCSLGESDSFYIEENISGFDITFNMQTTYFGYLTYTYNCTVNGTAESYIKTIDLVNAKTSFNAGETLTFGEEAKINCYNANGDLIKEISSSEFSNYITSYPEGYGETIGESLFIDEPINLTLTFQENKSDTWTIYVSYSEKLTLDVSNVKQKYYVNNKNEFVLDTSNIVIKETRHNNNSESNSIIENIIPVENVNFTWDDFVLDTRNVVVPIKVSYTNEIGQTLEKTFNVNIIKIEPVKIETSGDDNSTYYDNDTDTFKHPSGVTFNRVYSDNHKEVVSDINELTFYRDESLSRLLSTGISVIKKSEGSKIYVYDSITKTSGYYIISFVEDEITQVYLNNEVNFVLGNRFNSFRESFEIYVRHVSGAYNRTDNYTFKNTSIINESTSVSVIMNETEYELDSSKITFLNPTLDYIEVVENGFKKSYSNNVDIIDCSKIKLKVHYSDCEYIPEYSFYNGSIASTSQFIVTSEDLSSLISYDGTSKVSVEMGNETIKDCIINFSMVDFFNNEITRNKAYEIQVCDILDITGISIVSVYSDYHLGDKFLNEKDTTKIQIFFKDNNGIQQKFITNLNGGFSAINIYPTIGTEFNSLGQKNIKITSATNYNVVAEYSIQVSAKYAYDNNKRHSLTAIKIGSYTLPNGKVITNHYILIDEFNELGEPQTKILSTGQRVLSDAFTLEDIKVYGYLEDILDQSKNARVILFNDYIPPIEGSNNIEVTYPCYVEGNADKINKCHFGILFGNNNSKNRLFVSGNRDIPNCDWHSSTISGENVSDDSMLSGNFGYFEDTSWCYYGETDNSIVGYDIVSNDKLLVLKNSSDKETTIYFRTPTLVTAIDGNGNQMFGINGEKLYQEEFYLTKGNNSVAAISPKSIVNFNGDSLFISSDNNLVGLDLTGIIGDNQRYANTRSYYIDEDLRDKDLSKSWLWSDNKYMIMCLEDKSYVTHFETYSSDSKQYEWWVIDTKDIQVILKNNDILYYGNSEGQFFTINNKWEDISSVFIGKGGGILASEGEDDNKIIVSEAIINQLQLNTSYKFSIVPNGNEDTSYMYYSIGDISNVKNGTFNFYVNNSYNALELMCLRNGVIDYEEQQRVSAMISTKKEVYLNHLSNESSIGCAWDSKLKNYYQKYTLERYIPEDLYEGGDLYKLFYSDTHEEVNMTELYRAVLCYKLSEEYEVFDINKEECSFKLKIENQTIDLVRYADQLFSRAFKAEIKSCKPVQAFYITKPYNLGDLNYFKTIWQYTLTNDTNIPSELELTYSSNKIPYAKTKTLAKISVDKFSFSLDSMDFHKIDFDKNITPRTYTNVRILPRQKFICFGFRNYNNTNSVLSSMSIIYSIPHASYSGD